MRLPRGTILAVGDSSAERYDGLIVEVTDGPTVVKARWQPHSRMSDLFANGRISEYLTRILIESRHVMRAQAPPASPFPPMPRAESPTEITGFVPREPTKLVLLFVFGEADLWNLSRSPESNQDGVLLQRRVEERCHPLFSAIRALGGEGYRNLFLHALSPPTEREEPYWPPYSLRLELSLIFNRVFEDFCRSHDVGYVTLWDILADPERRREYLRDDWHLNKLGGARSIARLREQLRNREGHQNA